MTTATFPIDVETDALLTMLRVSGSFDIFKAGDIYKPLGQRKYPYGVLNRLPGGGPSVESMARPYEGWRSLWQLDAVGLSQAQAEGLAVWMYERLMTSDGAGGWAYPVALAGWSCVWRSPLPDLGTRAEGQPGKKLFVARRRAEIVWS